MHTPLSPHSKPNFLFAPHQLSGGKKKRLGRQNIPGEPPPPQFRLWIH